MSVIQTETVNKSWRNGKLGIFGKDSHQKLIYESKTNNKYQ